MLIYLPIFYRGNMARVSDLIILFMIGFITTYILVPFSMRVAKKIGAIDIPKEERKMHKSAMPRLGGLAVIIGFLMALIFLFVNIYIDKTINIGQDMRRKIIGYLLGGTVIAITGFLDDCKNLKASIKLIGQIVAAIIVISFGVNIGNIGLPFIGQNVILDPIVNYLITFLWIVGITNAINIIDGLDGLSSGISLISSLSLIFVFSINYSPIESILLITALAGSILGFLPYNSNPAKTFLGDMGAYFIGYSIAVISILGIAKTYTALVLLAPALALAIPIFDTIFAMVRRTIENKSIKYMFKPDANHIHHRLLRNGYNVKQTVYILYFFTAVFSVLAIILVDGNYKKAIIYIMIILVCLIIGKNDLKCQHQPNKDEEIEEIN